MFSNLRYFYIVSFVLIVIGAFVVGWLIRGMMADGLKQAVRNDTVSLAQSFINTIWQPYYPVNPAALGDKAATYMQHFQSQSQRFATNLSVVHFMAYDKLARPAFGWKGTSLARKGQPLLLDLTQPVYNGQIESDIVSRVAATSAVGTKEGLTVLRMLFPVRHMAYNPASSLCQNKALTPELLPDVCRQVIGVVEVAADVSDQWHKLDTIQWVSTASIVGIFVVLISLLMYSTRRAEAIIAKQHEMNLELTAAAANAEAENRDKSQFLANISHELRTPLNAIIGFSEIIKTEALDRLGETHREYILDIHNSGKHLLSLINDILDFSKAEAGKLEMELMEIDINKLVINSMRLVIPRAEQAQVTLVEDLPPEHIVCVTDGKKLKQVLLNLLSNAVKFTPPGGEVKVSAWQQLLDNKVCIQVRDTGIGIAPKDIAKVMSPFGQVDSKLSRKYEGTGLGLPLSKKFVEIMGGEFVIESEENVGTAITIKLPGIDNKNIAELQKPVA